jgi:hypothetical protein
MLKIFMRKLPIIWIFSIKISILKHIFWDEFSFLEIIKKQMLKLNIRSFRIYKNNDHVLKRI